MWWTWYTFLRYITMRSPFGVLGPACFAALTLVGPVRARVVDFPCNVFCSFQYIAANDPVNGNIWTGLAQSFTAQDANVLFGFYVVNYSGAAISETVLFSLYSGGGQFSNLLAQNSVTAALANDAVELLQVSFSSVPLTPGSPYTVVISLPGQVLPVTGAPGVYNPDGTGTGAYATLGVSIYSKNNSYAGGQFYYLGSSYSESYFADWDLAFNVTPMGEIQFDAIPDQIFGGSPFPIDAQAGPGLAVNVSSNTPAVCRVAGGLVTLLGTGTCSLTAGQGGASNTRSFTAHPANPSGTLTAATGSPFATGVAPWSIAVGDFNGDGIQDLAVANYGASNAPANNVTVLLGNGSGGFNPAPGSPFAVGTQPVSVE